MLFHTWSLINMMTWKKNAFAWYECDCTLFLLVLSMLIALQTRLKNADEVLFSYQQLQIVLQKFWEYSRKHIDNLLNVSWLIYSEEAMT